MRTRGPRTQPLRAVSALSAKVTLLNGSTGRDISIVMEDLKFRVRAHFGPQIANYTHDISFHVGDNEAVHTRHMDFILSGWSSGAHHRVVAPYTCGIWQLGRLTQLPNIGAPRMAQASNGTPPTATRSTRAARVLERWLYYLQPQQAQAKPRPSGAHHRRFAVG